MPVHNALFNLRQDKIQFVGNEVHTIIDTNLGIMVCAGKVLPNTLPGYAPGCTFHHIDGTNGTAIYVNEGTVATSVFKAMTIAD